MAIASILTHGAVNLDFPDLRKRRRWDDLDEVTQTFQRSAPNAFTVGSAFPGQAGFVIRDVSETEEVTVTGHECYVYELRGIGAGPGARILSRKETPNEEGWDTGSIRWLTTNKNICVVGQAMPGLPSMFCETVERDQHPQTDAYWYVTGNFKGQIAPKAAKIRWTQNGREISKENLVVGLAGGWGTPRKSEVLWPRIGCTISYVTTSLPETLVPNQSGDPPHPQAPWVFNPGLFGPETDFLWHWPNGWTLVGYETDIIPGKTMAFVVENWMYNHLVTFG